MIPFILAVLTTLIIAFLNVIDDHGKGLTLFLIFMVFLYSYNQFIVTLLKKEVINHRVMVYKEEVLIKKPQVLIKGKSFSIKNVQILMQSPHTSVGKNKCLLSIPSERIKNTNKRNIFLTLPWFWYRNPYNWYYNSKLGKITIYINQ